MGSSARAHTRHAIRWFFFSIAFLSHSIPLTRPDSFWLHPHCCEWCKMQWWPTENSCIHSVKHTLSMQHWKMVRIRVMAGAEDEWVWRRRRLHLWQQFVAFCKIEIESNLCAGTYAIQCTIVSRVCVSAFPLLYYYSVFVIIMIISFVENPIGKSYLLCRSVVLMLHMDGLAFEFKCRVKEGTWWVSICCIRRHTTAAHAELPFFAAHMTNTGWWMCNLDG